MPCTSSWWRLRFFTLRLHFLQILELLVGRLILEEMPLSGEVEGTSLRSFSFKLLIGHNEGKRQMLKTRT